MATGDESHAAHESLPDNNPGQPEGPQEHLKSLTAATPAPALLSDKSPELHVSLVQPGGNLQTPGVGSTHTSHRPPQQAGDVNTTSGDYFTPSAMRSHSYNEPPPRRQSVQVGALFRETGSPVESAEPGSGDLTNVDAALARHLTSQQGSIAAASIAQAYSASRDQPRSSPRLQPQRSMTEHPEYPNQSLHALQSQIYPESHHAPYASRPASSRLRPAALSGLTTSRSGSIETRQSRTAGNTPIQTPQLFSPTLPLHGGRGEPLTSSSAVPSPYLHPVQAQPPKETHKATKDVDTQSGRKTINAYEIQNELGKGAHGKVKLARNLDTGDFVAIKIVQRYSKKRRLGKAQGQEDKVKKEVAILKKAIHPNVVSMIEVIDDPDLSKIYLVLEFCESHDLKWRTFGTSDIVVIEDRRLQREMRGEPDVDLTASTDNMLRAAARKQERGLRRRRHPLSRINSETDFWSLEYAEESDEDHEDLSNSASMSRVQSGRPESAPPRSEITYNSLASIEESTQGRENLTQTSTTSASSEATVRDGRANSSDKAATTDRAEFEAEMQRRGAAFTENLRLHGDDGRGRKASIAESISHLTDKMESEIDEDLRYVPLLTLTESRRAFRDATLGIEYLHYQGIVHRDIKPENLLRKSDHAVKISDFGVSYLGKPIRDGRESEETSENESPDHEEEAELAKTVGTPAFYAPELCSLDFTSERPRVTGQIDVWALGVTLYLFVYARLPFIANNEFVMMRRISDDDVFFSRKRLRAVDPHSTSRSGSHGQQLRASKDHRFAHELLYDDVDDDLYDLLKRLLEKDPAKRITIKEIKHHPWVLHDIPHHISWLDETDPARFTQGKKIEISKEEVADAVMPLRLIERAKSVAKKVGGVLGIGTGRSGRRRGQSSATSSDLGAGSPGPGSSNTSMRGERADILRGTDNGLMTLPRVYQEPVEQHHHQDHPDHPLSQSVTASPDSAPDDTPFDEAFATHVIEQRPQASDPVDAMSQMQRPLMPERQGSVMSTAGSVRTLRQSDVLGHSSDRLPSPDENDVCTEQPTELPSNSTLGALFGGSGLSLMSRMRSHDRVDADSRSPNVPPSSGIDVPEDLHGEPSIALSNTSASGHVHGPDLASGPYSPEGAIADPLHARHASLNPKHAAALSAITEANLARHASPSAPPAAQQHDSHTNLGGAKLGDAQHHLMNPSEATELEYHEVRNMLARQRVLDDEYMKERLRPATQLRSKPLPLSADDDNARGTTTEPPQFLPLSEHQPATPSKANPISSNSSDDRFGSGMMSQSTSFPSVRSVVSANSSVLPDERSKDSMKDVSARLSAITDSPSRRTFHRPSVTIPAPRGPLVLTPAEEDVFSTDTAVETDEDDFSDEESGVLMMGGKKTSRVTSPQSAPGTRTVSGKKPQSRKSSRSGSSNTVKKVISRDEPESIDEQDETPRSKSPQPT